MNECGEADEVIAVSSETTRTPLTQVEPPPPNTPAPPAVIQVCAGSRRQRAGARL